MAPFNRSNKKKGLTSAGDAIGAILGSAQLTQALRPHMAKVYWDAVVGEQVGNATQVLAVRGGDTLIVRAKNGVWANELTLLKRDIISRLNRALGGNVLADIRFEIGTLDKRQAPSEKAQVPGPSADELALIAIRAGAKHRIESALLGIADPNLKAVVRRSLERAAQADIWKAEHGWLPCEKCGTLALPEAGAHEHLCPVCRVTARK
jgi:predicted nucleic acid-binding Zn ribbon protein